MRVEKKINACAQTSSKPYLKFHFKEDVHNLNTCSQSFTLCKSIMGGFMKKFVEMRVGLYARPDRRTYLPPGLRCRDFAETKPK